MPQNQSSLSFKFKDEQLFIRREHVCDNRIRAWPRPNAERLEARKANWERFYPEFRLINYPPPKPKKKKDTNQLELLLDVETREIKPRGTKREAYDQLRQTLPTGCGLCDLGVKNPSQT